ncbi:MAG: ATP-dependent sacrificial sulfur transferase LarE [Asgard group archaeon]|nr:ATP-dependent sacrificial sulfur transferase LarE [Asgard group archaeon]
MKEEQLKSKYEKLQLLIKKLKKVIVAFSGGVDSSFLAKISFDVLGVNATAITIAAPQLSDDEIIEAQKIAKDIGIKHFIIPSELVNTDWFETNPEDRCYICKKGNIELIAKYCQENNIEGQVIEGSNFDDLDDYRPGFQAVKEYSVLSPLVDVKLTKDNIRKLSKQLQLDCWDKPASPCLATRFPFGEKITVEKLKMVSQSEDYLKTFGIIDLRVRVHGDVARIETDTKYFDVLFKNSIQITEQLKNYGFSFVTIDLEGYKKGSMNKTMKK